MTFNCILIALVIPLLSCSQTLLNFDSLFDDPKVDTIRLLDHSSHEIMSIPLNPFDRKPELEITSEIHQNILTNTYNLHQVLTDSNSNFYTAGTHSYRAMYKIKISNEIDGYILNIFKRGIRQRAILLLLDKKDESFIQGMHLAYFDPIIDWQESIKTTGCCSYNKYTLEEAIIIKTPDHPILALTQKIRSNTFMGRTTITDKVDVTLEYRFDESKNQYMEYSFSKYNDRETSVEPERE